jgi:hypothetical protein
VQADIEYPIAQAGQHPIMENFRVQSFRQALSNQDSEVADILGELMFQVRLGTPPSHVSESEIMLLDQIRQTLNPKFVRP